MALKEMIRSDDAQHFKFEKIGDSISGHYIGQEEILVKGSPKTKYLMQTASGLMSFLESTDLKRNINTLTSQHGLGFFLKITYIDNVRGKNPLPMKKFSFQYDEENRVESAVVSSDPAPMETGLSDIDVPDDEVEEAPLPRAAVSRAPAKVSPAAAAAVRSVLNRK